MLAKPDPALVYINGNLRFWLGWAQEVAGDHAAAQDTWRQARSELESFLNEQPDNYGLIGDLALTNMGLGDKAAALALIERAMAANPIEKDPMDGPNSIEILARVSAKMGEPDRAIAALQKLLSIPTRAHWVKCRLLPRCSGSIRCSIRSGTIRASKNSAKRNQNETDNPVCWYASCADIIVCITIPRRVLGNFLAELKRRNLLRAVFDRKPAFWESGSR